MTKFDSHLSRRTLIFGIDGGTWTVLEPLIERGVMPRLAALREKGAWGNLESVVPVNSAAAWSSILTGMPPEKHGIFDFLNWHPRKPRRTSVNATWMPRPTLLDLMGHAGAVLALKIPMTYPPWDIPGAIVSGLPTPDDETAFTHPPELAPALNPLIEKGSAGRSWELEGDRRGVILDQMESAQRSLERMTDHLLGEYDFNTCFVVARDVDELQHFFWDVLTGEDPHEFLPRLEAYFARLDRYLERMLDWAGEDARVVILSDHGFGPVEAVWHLNDWLQTRGFLALKKEGNSPGASLSLKLRLNYALRRRLLRALQRVGIRAAALERSLEGLKFQSQSDTDLQSVDWSKTRAYTGNVGEEFLPVYINLEGREPFGSVPAAAYAEVREELRRALNECQVPAVLAVHRCEEIFDIEDPRRSNAPDLVIETLSGAVQSDFALSPAQTYEDAGFRKACHRRRGMFLLYGPDVIPQERAANLLDLPATILAWMGLPVPARFSGDVLAELILGLETGARRDSDWEKTQRRYFDDEDEDGVRRKLESLGYL